VQTGAGWRQSSKSRQRLCLSDYVAGGLTIESQQNKGDDPHLRNTLAGKVLTLSTIRILEIFEMFGSLSTYIPAVCLNIPRIHLSLQRAWNLWI
jgi:hypothetical protein